ncbi:hypothetical protein RJ640_028027 [Escallonia rubra]|uniref:DNA topoisomerase I n=1 Tax=Escallonia rubra TaxID=112253 RepID=A0AA88QF78_9ASTE|nr:hypothetical protein RJ640_028027 [Escallonia rubra]
MDEYDEEDGPLVFRRSNGTSKQSQLETVKHDGKPGRQKASVLSPNGQYTGIENGETEVSPVKGPMATTSSAEASPVKSRVESSDQSNQGPSGEAAREPDSEESDDGKPLSARIYKENSKKHSNGVSTSPSDIKHEDPDDGIPLSSKLMLKSTSFTDKSLDSNKLEHNGSVIRDNKLKRSSTVLGDVGSSVKRPKLSDTSTSMKSEKITMKTEPGVDDDDDVPISKRMKTSSTKPKLSGASKPIYREQVLLKAEAKIEEDDDHVPISMRMKKSAASSKTSASKEKVTTVTSSFVKKSSQNSKKLMKKSKYIKSSKAPPESGEGQKWTTLLHNGVIFPPPYKPHGVKILYKGQPMNLTPEQEEVATMYAAMLDTEYMNKPKFKENFMGDWRKILGKKHVIRSLEDCNFTPIYEWHQREKEKKKQMSTKEKAALKEEKMKLEDKYMWAVVDGQKEKVGNFRVEPPGLFRGRGEHPKMGKLKKRIRPSDITINIGKDATIPECPIPGERWKEIRHDNTVTWLAFWNDPINPKEFKYVFLAASSSLKGQSDMKKYNKARELKGFIEGIRAAYTKDFASKDITKRQIAVATYLIDKLALRAGNEKDDDEADTVGCCTLKVENVEPKPPNILMFDFLGKDSIRYQNEVEVELSVYKAIQQFRRGKRGNDDLFDKLDTSKLNAHLKELMPGLTAKVFRTYNASITLDEMLSKETKEGDFAEKIVVYQHANKEVAIICNHQRTVSKSHSAQMSKLNEKIDELKVVVEELESDLSRVKKGKPPLKSADGKPKRNLNPEALERKIAQTNAKIEKMERDKETKEDLKTVALGTSKINYLDPRITIAWCKRHEVPIEKIFNKSLLAKFSWAMDEDPCFRF